MRTGSIREAQNLNDQGDRALAIKKAKQALDAYPYQLRGLNLMGIMLRQAGDVSRARGSLGIRSADLSARCGDPVPFCVGSRLSKPD